MIRVISVPPLPTAAVAVIVWLIRLEGKVHGHGRELEKMDSRTDGRLGRIEEMIGSMARDLNQLIGKIGD